MKKFSFSLIALLITGLPLQSHAKSLSLESELYLVEWKDATFSIRHKPSGKAFATDGRFEVQAESAKVVEVASEKFGKGKAIEVRHPNGSRSRIEVFPGQPFVHFSCTLKNSGTEPVVLKKVGTFSAAIHTGRSVQETKTLGTKGLLKPAENPGSYAFLAFVDPESRAGAVGGWITHDRGSGVVFSPTTGDEMRLQARVDYGCLRIDPGKEAAAENFALGWFEDARLGLERYGDVIAKVYAIKLPPKQSGLCTWYMDKNAGACNERNIQELTRFAAENLKPFGFDFIQIDDGWQEGGAFNGPRKIFKAQRIGGPYPNGMRPAAEMIASQGLKPGIWLMPFSGTAKDGFFKKNLEWFVKNPKGEPYETFWGGDCLDMTHEGAREYVRSVIHSIVHDWGYTFLKLDGFWTGSATKQIYSHTNDGYKEDGMGDATFSNPYKTNVEALRDGAKLVREAAGPNTFLLGCCVSQNMRSFGGAMGLVDAMRIGPDTIGKIGAPNGSRLWFLNGRVWWNDPDCVYARKSTPLQEARLNATWPAISGQLFLSSDWLPDLPADRLDIVKRTVLTHYAQARPLDVFESDVARVWLLTGTAGGTRRDVLALYNWQEAPGQVSYPLSKTGLPAADAYVGFDFWANRFVPPFSGEIKADFLELGCRVVAVRPVADVPQLISTSRHVSQGVVDVLEEKWDAAAKKLTGISKLVGNDPYELRIVVPTGRQSWKVGAVFVSKADTKAGVTVSEPVQDGPKIRVTIHAPESREVKWSIAFERDEVTARKPGEVTGFKAQPEYRSVTLSWNDNGADCWRVTRNDGLVFETASPEVTDPRTKLGITYHYRVESIGWDNKLVKGGVELVVTTPSELTPPLTPEPDINLAELKPVLVETGYGKPGFNVNATGRPIRLVGKTFNKGLGVNAPSLAIYAIPEGVDRFVAVAGIDDADSHSREASVVLEVYGDVKEMGEQPMLLAKSPELSSKLITHWAFDVHLDPRFREIRLVVTDAGDGNARDRANWVKAGFMRKGPKP